jgi:hypothetical protein
VFIVTDSDELVVNANAVAAASDAPVFRINDVPFITLSVAIFVLF